MVKSIKNLTGASTSKMYRNFKGQGIPNKVLYNMRRKGANVDNHKSEALVQVHMDFKDDAWVIYDRWVSSVEGDPLVNCSFTPNANIDRTTICPPLNIAQEIIVEANSIVNHYATLLAEDFDAGLPDIPGPLVAPNGFTFIPHPTMAMSALCQRIQNPPAAYVVLNSLRSGSYICDVNYMWKSALVSISIYKS